RKQHTITRKPRSSRMLLELLEDRLCPSGDLLVQSDAYDVGEDYAFDTYGYGVLANDSSVNGGLASVTVDGRTASRKCRTSDGVISLALLRCAGPTSDPLPALTGSLSYLNRARGVRKKKRPGPPVCFASTS